MSLFNNAVTEQLEVLQDAVYKIPSFPYLWTPHCILMSMAVRATVGGLRFSRTNPLACYMMAVVYTFPGGILASLLLAEPPLAFLANTPAMVVMSLVWYLVFYAPYDIFYKLVCFLHIRLPLGFLQDILRIQLVIAAIQTIHAVYPNTILYPFVFATVKSSGFMFIKYAEAIIFTNKSNGFVVPNHHSKTCILAAILFIASDIGYLEVDKKPLLLLCVLIALSLRIASMMPSANVEPDPYLVFENVACYVLFGQDENKVETNSKDDAPLLQNGQSGEKFQAIGPDENNGDAITGRKGEKVLCFIFHQFRIILIITREQSSLN